MFPDIAKHMRRGRQEDSHEFLRYAIDALQKACLAGHPPYVPGSHITHLPHSNDSPITAKLIINSPRQPGSTRYSVANFAQE